MSTPLKVIAFDVYGTIICTNDPDNALPARKGFKEFILYVREKFSDIKIVTVSDGFLDILKIDLEDSGVDLQWFDHFFKMERFQIKDFARVTDEMRILPEEMLVVGDNPSFDYNPAINCGARALLVPEYESRSDNFNLFDALKPLIEG